MPCEPELLLFAGMNDHLHAAGLLGQLKGDEPTPKKIWEAIQTLFAAMNEVQEKCQFAIWTQDESGVHGVPGICEHAPCSAVCVCYFDPNSRRERMADPDGSSQSRAGTHELETSKSELAAAWADVSHALRGFYELADILIVLDEILLL